MDRRDKEELCNSAHEEETIARERKRARRVSFAELTSIHVFDRDDESDNTPQDTKPSPQNTKSEQPGEGLGFLRDFGDSSDDSKELSRNEDDDEDDDDDEEEDGRRGFFVRPIDSSSPGSGFGSATSNDEDNFFGPVSASFIKSGRLSDSAFSDENHDITLDSTAFTMHFRSLVQSQSEGNFKTPTRTELSFEEKSPNGNSTPHNSGSFMVLTGDDKPIPRPSVSGGNSSSVGGSNDDMSLIEDNPRMYEYGLLSPTLDALLAEGSKTMHDISVSNQGMPSGMDNETDKDVLEDGGGSKLEFGGGNNHTLTPPSETIQMDMIAQSDCAYQSYVQDIMKEDLLNGDAGFTPDIGSKANPFHNSPLEGSISSLSAKRRKLLLDTTVLPSSELINTPGKQPRSPLNNEKYLVPQIQGMPSGMDKDSAKDVLKDGGESKLEFGGGNNHTLAPLIETIQMDKIAQRDCEYRSHIEDRMKKDPLNGDAGSTPDIGSKNNRIRDSPLEGSISSLSIKRRKLLLDTTVLPSSELINTPGNQPRSPLNNENIRDDVSFLSIDKFTSKLKSYGTSLLGAAMEVGDGNSEPELSNYFCNSPLLATIGVGSNKDPNMKEINVSVTGAGENLLNVHQENREERATTEVGTYVVGTPRSIRTLRQKEVIVATVHDKELKGEKSAGVFCNNQNSGIAGSVLSSQFSMLRKDLQQHSFNNHLNADALVIPKSDSSQTIRVELNEKSQETGTANELNSSPLKQLAKKLSASPENSYISEALKQQKQYDKLVSSGIRQDSTDLRAVNVNTSCLSPMAEGPIMGLSLEGNIAHDTLLKQTNVQGTSTFIGNDNMSNSEFLRHNLQEESENIGNHETPLSYRTTLSPRFGSTERNFLTRTYPARLNEKVPEKTSSYHSASSYIRKRTTTPIRLEKIFLKSSDAIKGRLLPLADNLNPKEVCILEDMLGRLQKANKYKTLCNELQCQKIHDDDVVNLQQKRVAEARCLQQMLVYEQAKLQLKRLRHERLHKKVQLLQSGIQESQLLKLNSISNLCIPGARGDQGSESHLPSVSVDHNTKSPEAYNKVFSKRQELESLEQKVKGLTKSLLSSCKIKGEPNSTEIVVLVNDYLKKRANCRCLRQDLQVWEVDDLESKNFHHNLVLNYCHFLDQSFKVNVGPVSSIVITNRLNDENIMKSFPTINASTAFAFVLESKSTRNLGSPKHLALETQSTSLLLSTLLDVVEEAHTAHIELRNLIKTSFYSPSVEQLNLQLHFIDFKTGYKVTVILDMTSLNRGVYPSDILPSQLQTEPSGTQSPVTQLLSAEILAAVGGLKSGYSRIIRLCRCVSQVLKSRCM